MLKVTVEEVRKIAAMSQLSLAHEEVIHVVHQLEEVLTYAARVQQLAAAGVQSEYKQVNVFRDDKACSYDVQQLLIVAPEKQDGYFVVPKVVDSAR